MPPVLSPGYAPEDPKISEMARLEQVTRGVKRKYAHKSPGKRKRLPITPER